MMKWKLKLSVLLIVACSTAVFAAPAPPKLILQITVDQLRGDQPSRYLNRMGEGGFRYLLEQGIVYKDAHHRHSNTETVVGHSTLATGADPAQHGMVANVWFDRDTGKLTYNIEDASCRILTAGADVDKSTEIDASQALASTDGRSPANIMVSTFSDELLMRSNGKAKVFAVSVKDRGAVTMAGHAGKAFWFSKASAEFITSSYYYDEYPAWVTAWNQQKKASAYAGTSWALMHDPSTYLFGAEDDQPWEMDMAGFGRTFPHAYGSDTNKNFGNYLTFSPAGDELTLDFAKMILEAEQLGKDEVTDYLAISFSTTDYVGHLFGNSSLESEDNLLRLDRTLADLFAFVDQKVGLTNTLIVLSADHGGPEAPGYWKSVGLDAGYVSPDEWDKEPAMATLKKKFGISERLIQPFFPPYVYLNREVIEENGLDFAEVEQAVAHEIGGIHGVAMAITSTELRKNRLPDTYLTRAALRNFNPKRSGDILVLFQPHYFINNFQGEVVSCNHGGPWAYDTFVPIIFAGNGLVPQKVYRRVETVDIARTLAAEVGTKPPSGCQGKILSEVVKN